MCVGGPCDFSVTPSPLDLGFGIGDWGLGLDNKSRFIPLEPELICLDWAGWQHETFKSNGHG